MKGFAAALGITGIVAFGFGAAGIIAEWNAHASALERIEVGCIVGGAVLFITGIVISDRT